MHPDPEYAASALDAGASGYLIKNVDADDIRSAVREAAAGGTYLPPAIATEILAKIRKRRDSSDSDLSERQLEILRQLAEGKTAKEIAHDLDLSRKTIEYHKYKLQEMLGVKSSAELIRIAIARGFVDS